MKNKGFILLVFTIMLLVACTEQADQDCCQGKQRTVQHGSSVRFLDFFQVIVHGAFLN